MHIDLDVNHGLDATRRLIVLGLRVRTGIIATTTTTSHGGVVVATTRLFGREELIGVDAVESGVEEVPIEIEHLDGRGEVDEQLGELDVSGHELAVVVQARLDRLGVGHVVEVHVDQIVAHQLVHLDEAVVEQLLLVDEEASVAQRLHCPLVQLLLLVQLLVHLAQVGARGQIETERSATTLAWL